MIVTKKIEDFRNVVPANRDHHHKHHHDHHHKHKENRRFSPNKESFRLSPELRSGTKFRLIITNITKKIVITITNIITIIITKKKSKIFTEVRARSSG